MTLIHSQADLDQQIDNLMNDHGWYIVIDAVCRALDRRSKQKAPKYPRIAAVLADASNRIAAQALEAINNG